MEGEEAGLDNGVLPLLLSTGTGALSETGVELVGELLSTGTGALTGVELVGDRSSLPSAFGVTGTTCDVAAGLSKTPPVGLGTYEVCSMPA